MARPGDRRDLLRARIKHANPGEYELAMFHRDAACLLKKLLLVADAHDGRVNATEYAVDAVEADDPGLVRLVLGDVARDFRNAHDRPRFIPDRRFGEVHENPPAVFGQANCLVMFDMFSLADPGDNFHRLIHMFLRNQKSEMLPSHFLGGITVEMLRAPVPGQDISIRCHADDRVI